MTPDLSRRAARAMDVGAANPEERETIITAVERAQTFDDLPEAVQRLILRLEQPPGQATTQRR